MSRELQTGTTAGFGAIKIHMSQERGCTKVNLWASLMRKLIGPFLFSEKL
jgi:hypothetical protein